MITIFLHLRQVILQVELLEYSIDGGLTWQPSNIFTGILNNTMYSVMVRVKGAKMWYFTGLLYICYHNAITPNMDGVNDTIDFTGISGYKDLQLQFSTDTGRKYLKASKGNVIWTGSLKRNQSSYRYLLV